MQIKKLKQLLIRTGLWYPLDKLRSVPKMMLWMKYYENASSRMISNQLHVQEACVPMYVKRARKKWKKKELIL